MHFFYLYYKKVILIDSPSVSLNNLQCNNNKPGILVKASNEDTVTGR